MTVRSLSKRTLSGKGSIKKVTKSDMGRRVCNRNKVMSLSQVSIFQVITRVISKKKLNVTFFETVN